MRPGCRRGLEKAILDRNFGENYCCGRWRVDGGPRGEGGGDEVPPCPDRPLRLTSHDGRYRQPKDCSPWPKPSPPSPSRPTRTFGSSSSPTTGSWTRPT